MDQRDLYGTRRVIQSPHDTAGSADDQPGVGTRLWDRGDPMVRLRQRWERNRSWIGSDTHLVSGLECRASTIRGPPRDDKPQSPTRSRRNDAGRSPEVANVAMTSVSR
jgi:hypothetical protein